MTATLTILTGDQKGETYVLQDGENSIGRSSSSTICVNEGTISRHHASIVVEGNTITLQKFSQNGNLKVDSKEVRTYSLQSLHKLQIGKVLFKFQRGGSNALMGKASNPPARSQSQGLQGMDQEETLLLSSDELEEQGPTLDAPPSKFSWAALLKVVILSVLAIVAFVVTRSIETKDVPTVVMPYRAGEEKLIDLQGYLSRYNISSRPSQLELDEPMVMRAQMDPPPLNILWFKTLQQGECRVLLKSGAGQPLLELKFEVKGALETKSEQFDRENLSPKQVESKARELMAKGDIIRKESPYEAYQYYEEAIRYLETVSTSSPIYFECRESMKEPKEALDKHLEQLWKEANRYRKNKSYARALTFVENILDLVKDPHNIDHQRAQIHKKYILKRVKL